VGGFDSGLIAGEEPELCARMRERGGRIMRLAHDMAWHDLAMTTSAQWFKRARRHGHAIIEVSYFKTNASRGLFAGQVRSAVVWGGFAFLGLLCSISVLAATLGLLSIILILDAMGSVPIWMQIISLPLLFVGWPMVQSPFVVVLTMFAICALWYSQLARIGFKESRRGRLSLGNSLRYARLIMISKEYQVRGMIDFLWRRWRGKRAEVISYKESTAPAA
jgi:hypothetical protein